MMTITQARKRALQWFADHETDPSSVLLTERPSTRMLNLMLQDGQLVREPVGQFKYERWLLTEQGRELLTGSPTPPSTTPHCVRVVEGGVSDPPCPTTTTGEI